MLVFILVSKIIATRLTARLTLSSVISSSVRCSCHNHTSKQAITPCHQFITFTASAWLISSWSGIDQLTLLERILSFFEESIMFAGAVQTYVFGSSDFVLDCRQTFEPANSSMLKR
ncbi:hypothetical protein M758_4G119700 [Ceratodon purpureus]|nr:hypothetical protein M758_4G119700 [Ceratodon purpureus]